MTRTRQPIQSVVPKRLGSSFICQTRAIPHAVVEVVGFVDLRAGGRELMEDIGHLRSGIVGVRRLRPVGQREGGSPAQRVIGEGVRARWARETGETIERIVGRGIRVRAIRQRESIPVLVVGIRQRHARLIEAARRAGGQEPIGLVIRHRQCAVRIRHREQIAHSVIRVAGGQSTRKRLAQQLIHGVVGKDNLVHFGRDPLGQIVVAVVLVGFRFTDLIAERSHPGW